MTAHRDPRVLTDEGKVRRLTTVTDPSIARYLARLRKEFGKYVIAPADLQREIAAAMGDRRLTDVLYEMRRER